jgi:hypothetical protein
MRARFHAHRPDAAGLDGGHLTAQNVFRFAMLPEKG